MMVIKPRDLGKTSANPVLLVKDAGRGETPPCPDAKYARGDVVRARGGLEGVVAVAIPAGFPAEYALADLLDEPRPLMITKPLRAVSYIVVRENDARPHWLREKDLRATGERVEIGTIQREADNG